MSDAGPNPEAEAVRVAAAGARLDLAQAGLITVAGSLGALRP